MRTLTTETAPIDRGAGRMRTRPPRRLPQRAPRETPDQALPERPAVGRRPSPLAVSRPKLGKLPIPVFLFLIGLVVPWIITVGPLRMSVYRLVLVGAIVPCIVLWANGRAGRFRVADFMLFAFAFWCMLSMAVNHGPAQALQPAGIFFIETMGPYLLARCFIRTADDFYRMVLVLFVIVAVLLPFAILEAVTGAKPLLTVLGAIFPTSEVSMMQPRWGLRRVQGPLDHAILFGTFCGSIFALVVLVLGRGRSLVQRAAMAGMVFVTAALSLSSAPIAAMLVQGGLLSWNTILKRVAMRWKLLVLLAIGAYLLIATVSNQSVPAFYISHFTFEGQTGWFRLLIWEFGSRSVTDHPLFGVAFNEWARPSWMPNSIDNFWLLNAVRHGIPAVVILAMFFLSIYGAVVFKKGLSERLCDYRTAFLIVIAAFMFVGWTVHFWNSAYVLLLFIAGSGSFLLEEQKPEPAPESAPRTRTLRGRTLRSAV